VLDGCALVLYLDVAHVEPNIVFEGTSPTTRASVIAFDDKKTHLGEALRPQI
jgi:hypothetical protein